MSSALGCRLASVAAAAIYVDSRVSAVLGDTGRVEWWIVGGWDWNVVILNSMGISNRWQCQGDASMGQGGSQGVYEWRWVYLIISKPSAAICFKRSGAWLRLKSLFSSVHIYAALRMAACSSAACRALKRAESNVEPY